MVNKKDKYGRTALRCAIDGGPERWYRPSLIIVKGQERVVEILLGPDAKVDKQDRKGRTALHLAASFRGEYRGRQTEARSSEWNEISGRDSD